MAYLQPCEKLRFCLPQLVTSVRILLGGWAIVALTVGTLEVAAVLIILGVISDAFDGTVARKLKVASEFGALFDYFADYLCFIVVPAMLSFLLVSGSTGMATLLVIAAPLLAGALRYARMDGLRRVQSFDQIGYPGLSTVLYTCFVIALFFLAHQDLLSGRFLGQVTLVSVPVLSVLMVAPVRYPKLVNSKSIMIPVLAGLGIMPFFFTTIMASIAVAVILLYVIFSPFLIDQRPELGSGRSDADSSVTSLFH